MPELFYPDPLQEEEREIERILMEEDDDLVDASEAPSIELNSDCRIVQR